MKLCRLCSKPSTIVFHDTRIFFACNRCGLIFTDRNLSDSDSIKHYIAQHDNGFNWIHEADYILKLIPTINDNYAILDYGSGCGLLAKELRERGFNVSCYEPMYDGLFDLSKYNYNYDVIILNEVIEHVDNILLVLNNIYYSLKSKGYIIIKTLRTDSIIISPFDFETIFKSWWYKDDLTHISFFSYLTFEYICNNMFDNLKIIHNDALSVVMYKDS